MNGQREVTLAVLSQLFQTTQIAFLTKFSITEKNTSVKIHCLYLT
jgi:hypothetical protein